MKNKLICFLLLIIIISSSILIYKIEQNSVYDSEIYAQVYKEYEEIVGITENEEEIKEQISGNSSTQREPIVINKNSTGSFYRTIAVLNIPKINLSYPIINDYSEANLNIAPTKLLGPAPNKPGNFVIVGHNNWNKEFFSNLHKLENDDIVELTDFSGNKVIYKVYYTSEIKQDDFSCLEQDTNEKTELTLITCIKYKKSKRLIVKCVAI